MKPVGILLFGALCFTAGFFARQSAETPVPTAHAPTDIEHSDGEDKPPVGTIPSSAVREVEPTPEPDPQPKLVMGGPIHNIEITRLGTPPSKAVERNPDDEGDLESVYRNVSRLLPEADLVEIIERETKLKMKEFGGKLSAAKLSQKLMDAAFSPGVWQQTSAMGLEIDAETRLVRLPRATFYPEHKKIFTSFTFEGGGVPKVLVKWMRYGEEAPISFSAVRINPARDANNVWLEVDKGWKPGTYFVEIYDPQNLDKARAGATFFVADRPAEGQ